MVGTKDLNLNLLLDAEVSKLRDTIKRGLTEGQWDLKVGGSEAPAKQARLFIKTDGPLTLPDILEFSERMELYRRGILKPPEPREIELSAQVLPSPEPEKPVQVRWRARGALTVTLFQDRVQIPGEFRPSDEYSGTIRQTIKFKMVVDYGKGEIVEQETQAIVYSSNSGPSPTPTVNEQGTLFKTKPEQIELEGSVNSVFNDLNDQVIDLKIQAFESIQISVGQVIDFRKLGTALPLMSKLPMQIEQLVTIQTGDQFTRLGYQGPVRGYQSFFGPINMLLNTPEVQANVFLRLVFEFNPAIAPDSAPFKDLKQALGRNPVERLKLAVKVCY